MDHEIAVSIHSNTNMECQHMSIYQPYTYLIGWTNHNKWYYGVRYAANANPNDLWKTYFTSSKYVKKFIGEYDNPDIIQIRKIFQSKQSAILWEQKVLQRLNVRHDDKWLNINDCSAPPLMIGEEHPLYGIGHSVDTKKKISEKNKGKLKGKSKTEEHRRLISESRKKNWAVNDELRRKLSEKMKGNDYGKYTKGRIPSEETKKRLSISKKNKKQRRCSCLLCHREISVSNIVQHYRFKHT